MASNIEGALFNLRVASTSLANQAKEEVPTPEAFRLPMMSGVNFFLIQTPTFDGNIMNWKLFWDQFQAIVHDKSHLGDVDQLT